MNMHRLLFCTAIFLQTLLALRADAATDIEFVLDLSGSMKQKLGAETQVDSARKALLKSLDEIPSSQLVAIRVYGHRIDQSKKEESCKDTELIVPFQEVKKQLISEKLAALNPQGYTPIAYALQETRNDLLDVGAARETERVIILLTDGEETCGGDPIAVLKQLKAEGFKLTVFTVGFNVNDVARQQLQGIADFSGGKYFDAKDATQLNKALQSAAQQSSVIEKSQKTYGSEIRGGDSYEDAKPIEFDKEYKLDHHQQARQYDYFYIDLDRATEIDLRLTTGEKSIGGLKEGKQYEGNHPYGGAQIHGQERNNLKSVAIFGEKFKTAELQFRPAQDGRYYLLIGTDNADIHKDHLTFKLTKVSRGDLGTTKDAGESFEEALPIEAKRYEKNSIGENDKVDVFSFTAKAGDKFFVGIIPGIKNRGYFVFRVLDEFRQEIFQQNSHSESGLKTKEFALSDDGTYYAELTYHGDDSVPYVLILKRSQPLEGGQTAEASPADPS